MNQYDFQYAPFYKRFFARIIDILIVYIITYLLAIAYTKGSTTDFLHNPSETDSKANFYCMFLYYLFYCPILDSKGGTIGKRILGIQIVSISTFENITLKQAHKRSFFLYWPIVLYFVFTIAYFIILGTIDHKLSFFNNKVFVNITILMMGMFFLIGFLSPLSMIWSKQKQGWHDWWSNSIVINKQ